MSAALCPEPTHESTAPAQGSTESWRVEQILEYACSRGLSPRVDPEAGVISGVKILGLESRNGRLYRPAAVADAAALYDGVKVNVNHQKGRGARDYQDRLGCLRSVEISESGLFGDLHFNPHHPIARQLAWDAAHSPECVGLSHNVQARTSRQNGETIVEEILHVNSVDLVADPATTSSLFESERDNPADDAAPRGLSITDVQAIVREARLPSEAATQEFIEQLVELDETVVRKLVQERARLVHSLTPSRTRPKSKGPQPESDGDIDIRRWARLIT
jgi:hypothetical protein